MKLFCCGDSKFYDCYKPPYSHLSTVSAVIWLTDWLTDRRASICRTMMVRQSSAAAAVAMATLFILPFVSHSDARKHHALAACIICCNFKKTSTPRSTTSFSSSSFNSKTINLYLIRTLQWNWNKAVSKQFCCSLSFISIVQTVLNLLFAWAATHNCSLNFEAKLNCSISHILTFILF